MKVKETLEKSKVNAANAIDEVKKKLHQQVDNFVESLTQDLNKMESKNLQQLNMIDERLRTDLVMLRVNCDAANIAVQPGSESHLITVYPSLADSLQTLSQSQPNAADGELGQIKFNPGQQHFLSLLVWLT